MLSDEEMLEIKEKIINQVESTFPEEQIPNAVSQIKAMNSEQLEKFLERNSLIKSAPEEKRENECVFCSIVSDKIKSVKLEENDNAVAILEINPISKGHALIIPKEHSEKAPKEASSLAKKISKKIEKKLKPKGIEISKSRLFGHEVINVIPVYSNESSNSERKKAKIEELEEIKKEIEKETKKAIRKPRTKKIKEFPWLPKRIP